MSAPVDATTTAAWRTLTGLKAVLEPDLRGWFAADPARAQAFTLTAGDLHVDLSKNLIDDAVLTALVELAEQVGLAERRDAMFAGEKINVTEGRAVLHTALRDPDGAEVVVDGTNVVPEVHRGAREGLRVRRPGAQRRVEGRHRQADRDSGQHRHRWLRPRPGDGLRGPAAVREGRG